MHSIFDNYLIESHFVSETRETQFAWRGIRDEIKQLSQAIERDVFKVQENRQIFQNDFIEEYLNLFCK